MPYKDKNKRREASRKSMAKRRKSPTVRRKEKEYRNSGAGREKNARAQRRWRWRHNRQLGDRKTEILSHTKNQKNVAKAIREEVKRLQNYKKGQK